MTIKRGYLVGGGTLGLLVGMFLVQTGSAVAPGPNTDQNSYAGRVLGAETANIRLGRGKPGKPAGAAGATSSTTTNAKTSSTSASSSGSSSSSSPNTLIWEQDFSLSSSLDSSFWNIATPSLPIYNGEAQKYYNQSSNVRIEGGHLVLEAHKAADGSYSSGRVDTKGRKAIDQGSRVEARMKLPKGRGTWPAFWMLSGNNQLDLSLYSSRRRCQYIFLPAADAPKSSGIFSEQI